jgi:hypothetical protein
MAAFIARMTLYVKRNAVAVVTWPTSYVKQDTATVLQATADVIVLLAAVFAAPI